MTPPPPGNNPPAPSMSSQLTAAQNTTDLNALYPPSRAAGRDGRSLPAPSLALSARTAGGASGQSYATTITSTGAAVPGSFSSELRTHSRAETPRAADYSFEEDVRTSAEQRQAELRDRIEKETKIKIGSENLLEALNTKSAKQSKEQKARVEQELNTSNRKLQALKLALEADIQRSRQESSNNMPSRLTHLFRHSPVRTPSRRIVREEVQPEPETESPTYVLAEILQALEREGMQPDYYVERANNLVDLFKRHPTLKYDLAWSIFGLRMQTMLLSDSREVIASGYRVIRYAIADRKSLQTIRALHTDYIVILSLVKESKASIEREQAVKFVRAFMEVKDGVKEISPAIIRVLVAVAEHSDDRLKNIATLTLAEILIRDPTLLVSSGGIGVLTEALGEGHYHAAESLSCAFLYLLDVPSRRKFLRSGHELEIPFATFTEAPVGYVHEERLKANAKVIASLLKTWPGLVTLSMNSFISIKSLVSSLYIPHTSIRNVLLELFIDVLRIKPPSWSSSFLAGRRLTTYGRVMNLKTVPGSQNKEPENLSDQWNLIDHFIAVMLTILLQCGLLEALLHAEEDPLSEVLKRKTTLVLGEVLKMSNELLPNAWSAPLQVLPNLLRSATKFDNQERFVATGTIYQIDSVNRTLYRSGQTSLQNVKSGTSTDGQVGVRPSEQPKSQLSAQMDEAQFRAVMLQTEVLSTVNWQKWRWDIILAIIDGPLRNAKRLDEATRGTKFIHRAVGFYRPFKLRFCEIKNTKPNQRYIRIGCALITTMLQNMEGVRYLAESKLIRQIAECLAHNDPMSGLTSASPLFSPERLTETLTHGYFALLGALSKETRGVQILERWKIFNMFYHIIDLADRDDLVKLLLGNMDYTLDGHLRILISKAMTSCSKDVRIFATRVLRKYATKQISQSSVAAAGTAEWAIKLLVTQLYDPEIEVCEVAIKILEEACNQKHSLEYVVKCRPALDHLGEIGAPLLLRFLSTSVGYHYLDGLDYITREMDDWFLGRNDTYVVVVEASLARALADLPEKPQAQNAYDDTPEPQDYGMVPPHFYRELTRTHEGCKLLEQKGHFDDFVSTIQEYRLDDEDAETVLKVKGCLWAVGNVGSMDLGSPFLEKSDITKSIVRIAEEAEVMSLRGTAFFVLGLISRSLHGQEILVEYGWDSTVDELGNSLGLCLPLDFRKLFAVSFFRAFDSSCWMWDFGVWKMCLGE